MTRVVPGEIMYFAGSGAMMESNRAGNSGWFGVARDLARILR